MKGSGNRWAGDWDRRGCLRTSRGQVENDSEVACFHSEGRSCMKYYYYVNFIFTSMSCEVVSTVRWFFSHCDKKHVSAKKGRNTFILLLNWQWTTTDLLSGLLLNATWYLRHDVEKRKCKLIIWSATYVLDQRFTNFFCSRPKRQSLHRTRAYA